MNIEIKELRKKDYKKAIGFAITGMNFTAYLDSNFLLNLYGKYFWRLELGNATQVIAAYINDELAGVMLADIYGEDKKYGSVYGKIYVAVFEWIQRTFFKNSVGVYDDANKEMLAEFKSKNAPNGEIRFLAANPDINVKGIGTALLNELEKREKNKLIFLFTDDRCTYQFYEHRGFERSGEREILLNLGGGDVPLKCFLYSKNL